MSYDIWKEIKGKEATDRFISISMHLRGKQIYRQQTGSCFSAKTAEKSSIYSAEAESFFKKLVLQDSEI